MWSELGRQFQCQSPFTPLILQEELCSSGSGSSQTRQYKAHPVCAGIFPSGFCQAPMN